MCILMYYFYDSAGYFQRGLAKLYLSELTDAEEDFVIAADLGEKRAALILEIFYD